MKTKTLIITLIAIMFTLQSNAQLGVQLGANFAKIDGYTPRIAGIGVPGLSEEYLSNVSGGVYFDKDLIPLVDLRIGVMYSPKGANYANEDGFVQTGLNYIEVPIQAKVKAGPIYVLGGAYGAYALSGYEKNQIEVGGLLVESNNEINFEESEYRKEDFGLKFGLGVQFGLGPLHIFVQGDYSMGLLDIYNGDDVYTNKVLGATAGVNIGF